MINSAIRSYDGNINIIKLCNKTKALYAVVHLKIMMKLPYLNVREEMKRNACLFCLLYSFQYDHRTLTSHNNEK